MAGKTLCILIAALGWLGTACAEQAVLAEAGQARMPIVLAQEATERQRELAEELAGILQQISGAESEVITGDGSRGLILGTLDQFPMPDWQKTLEVRGHDGREAYGIRSEADRLLVIGATDVGLDRGITKLLETLGCRWFFPNAIWHIIPRSDGLAEVLLRSCHFC